MTGGGRVFDAATLSDGYKPSGQIAFNLYGPGDTHCSKAPVFTDRVPVDGNGHYRTELYAPRAPGNYRFTATLPGDANNRAANSPCNAPGESVAAGGG